MKDTYAVKNLLLFSKTSSVFRVFGPNVSPSLSVQKPFEIIPRGRSRVTDGSTSGGIEEFGAEALERYSIIDIVPCRQQVYFHVHLFSTRDGLFEDTVRTP
jgi:hypothetical protein